MNNTIEYIVPELDTVSALAFANDINRLDLSIVHELVFEADMKWVRPYGMLVAAMAIKDLRRRHPEILFRLQCDTARNGISYAAHMGFFKSISENLPIGNAPGEASGNADYLPITQIDIIELQKERVAAGQVQSIGDTIEHKSAELTKVICRDNNEMQALMTYLVREILRNIPEHSDSSKAWICGQYWSDNTAEIAIVDEGIGIKNSLQRNVIHRQYIEDDLSALQLAIKAGISQSFHPGRGNRSDDVWANSGYGLFMVSEICKELGGSFCIASGENYLYLDSLGQVTSNKTHINGTAVKMTFSTDKLKNSHEIIRSIAGRGEAIAHTIKNAFKNASHPSKGLIFDL